MMISPRRNAFIVACQLFGSLHIIERLRRKMRYAWPEQMENAGIFFFDFYLCALIKLSSGKQFSWTTLECFVSSTLDYPWITWSSPFFDLTVEKWGTVREQKFSQANGRKSRSREGSAYSPDWTRARKKARNAHRCLLFNQNAFLPFGRSLRIPLLWTTFELAGNRVTICLHWVYFVKNGRVPILTT